MQVGASMSERSCFCAETESERKRWIESIRQGECHRTELHYANLKCFPLSCSHAVVGSSKMLERYHDGIYGIDAANEWSCCKVGSDHADGCKIAACSSPSRTSKYFTCRDMRNSVWCIIV